MTEFFGTVSEPIRYEDLDHEHPSAFSARMKTTPS